MATFAQKDLLPPPSRRENENGLVSLLRHHTGNQFIPIACHIQTISSVVPLLVKKGLSTENNPEIISPTKTF